MCGKLTKIVPVCKLYSQLGAQFDGYCSTVATTIVVGAKEPVTGAKADVIKAAETALEAAIRLIRPGNKVKNHFV
jgi:Xaa-Pro aminopeptidase